MIGADNGDGNGNGVDGEALLIDSINILHKQRLVQHASRREELEQVMYGVVNSTKGAGLMNNHMIRNNGVTNKFPPTLMHHYELQILLVGQTGEYLDFRSQYHRDCDN